jgi:hypothetical protein
MQRLVLVVVVVAASATAHADPRADKLFAEGRVLINKGDAKGACEKFDAAYRIDPTAPGIMLNLGLCNQMLGKFGTSLRWFRKAQAASAEAKADDFKAEAEKRTVELATKVSTIKIDAANAPPGVEVRIDGELIDHKDYPLYEIDDGEHKLEARAPGKRPYRQDLKVANHDSQTVTLPVLADAPRPIVVDRGKNRRRIAYGLGALGLGLETWMVIYNLNKKDDSEQHPENAQQDKDDIRVKGTALFVAGALALGGAVVLYVTAPGKETMEQTAIAPVVGPDQFGFAVSGRF